MSLPNVHRDKISEGRADYFVTYQPADGRFVFAIVDLVFPGENIDSGRVARAMEDEVMLWLRRYAVPVMVSAFNAKEDIIRVRPESPDCHLMGFCDPKSGQVVLRWGLLKNDELPPEQADDEYLRNAYKDIEYHNQSDIRDAALHKARRTAHAVRTIVLFIIVVPALIEITVHIISLSNEWIHHAFAGVSIFKGVYELGKRLGWIKASAREKLNVEEDRKMKHYYWHCERNPAGFNRLKVENFERETIERTRKDFEAISNK
ncbi:MAG: hypothetical protein HY286_08505 [Planctomycetes bacterium]|nr:hypothetical protein [Planctomycetota bacterium]